MSIRRTSILLLIGILALFSSGCVQLPKQSSGRSPVRPASQPEVIKKVVDDAGESWYQAIKQKDVSKLSGRTDAERIDSIAEVTMAKRLDWRAGRPDPDEQPVTEQIMITPRGQYPARAVWHSTWELEPEDDGKVQRLYTFNVLTRQTATDP